MTFLRANAILCAALLIAQNPYTFAQQAQPGAPQGQTQKTLTPQQLDSLVAPIALYPDPILSQTLVASTYPLEIVEAGRWVKEHSNLKGQALADAARQQSWDASVQALVALPDVLNQLNQNVSWTSDLGNAFMAQQDGVMDAIQRMRQKASSAGVLKSNQQQTVSTTTENGQNYIVIEPASPDVVAIPQYNPMAVWGPAPAYYPYPSMYYPPYSTGAYIAASAISFGAGVALGAFWGGGWGGWHGWGWNAGWGGHNVVVNRNFINNNHFNRVNVGNGNAWVHNPAHRGNMPYGNRPGAGANLGRPTVGQTQQMLQRGGGANRMAPGTNFGQRGLGQPSTGGANRMAPGTNFGQRGIGQPSTGGANRMAPGGNFGGANRMQNFGGANRGGGAQMGGSRGFGGGGGGFHGGGGGFHGGGGGFRGGGGGRRR